MLRGGGSSFGCARIDAVSLRDDFGQRRHILSSTDISAIGAWLGTLFTSAPLFVAYLVAMVIALIRWRQDNVRCATTLIAALLLFFTDLTTSFITVWLPLHAISSHEDPKILGVKFACLAVVRSALHAVSFALLTFAIFSKRKADAQTFEVA